MEEIEAKFNELFKKFIRELYNYFAYAIRRYKALMLNELCREMLANPGINPADIYNYLVEEAEEYLSEITNIYRWINHIADMDLTVSMYLIRNSRVVADRVYRYIWRNVEHFMPSLLERIDKDKIYSSKYVLPITMYWHANKYDMNKALKQIARDVINPPNARPCILGDIVLLETDCLFYVFVGTVLGSSLLRYRDNLIRLASEYFDALGSFLSEQIPLSEIDNVEDLALNLSDIIREVKESAKK